MNALETLFARLVEAVSLPAPLLLAKVTLLLAVAWLVHAALRRQNPRWRVLVWRLTALGCVLLAGLATCPPLVHWAVLPDVAPRGATPVAESPGRPANDASSRPTPAPVPSVRAEQGRGAVRDPVRTDTAEPDSAVASSPSTEGSRLASPNPAPHADGRPVERGWGEWAMLVWCGGLFVLSIRTALGAARVRAICRRAKPVEDEIVDRALRIARDLGTSGAAKATPEGRRGASAAIRQSPDVPTPCLVGLWRPTILLPAPPHLALDRDELTAVLAHELAHVRGRDLFWNAVLHALAHVLWFHPLAWRVRNSHAAACDAVCDAVAADYLGDTAAYTRTLARLAVRVASPVTTAGLAMARPSSVRRRVRALQRHVFHAPLRRGRALALIVGAVASAVVMGTLSFTHLRAQAPPEPAAEGGAPPVPLLVERSRGEMIEEIEERIEEHRAAGDDSGADELVERLWTALLPLDASFEHAMSEDLELHVVAVRKGLPHTLERSQAFVTVTHHAAPIILCLTGESFLEWHVQVAPGVDLRQVILAGEGYQTVRGVADGVSVVDYSRIAPRQEHAVGFAIAKNHRDRGPYAYNQMADRLRELTNLEITTFQGVKEVVAGEPIVVGPASESWREEMALPRIGQLYLDVTREGRNKQWQEIHELRFNAVYFPAEGGRDSTAAYGLHTVLGPVADELQEVRSVERNVAIDPHGPTLYSGSVTLYDLSTDGWRSRSRLNSPIQLSDRRAELPGLAFDTKRNRLVAIESSLRAGFIYGYAPDEEKWTILGEFNRRDAFERRRGDGEFPGPAPAFPRVMGACYSEAHDAIYCVGTSPDAPVALWRLSPDGEVQSRHLLRSLDRFQRGFGVNMQMAAVRDYLVLIIPADGPFPQRERHPARVYVVEPHGATLLYSGDQLEPMTIEAQQQIVQEWNRATGDGHLAPPLSDELREARVEVVHSRGPILNPQNGHYYEYLSGPQEVTWHQAKEAAAARTHKGMRGYLATINSAEEEQFLVDQFAEGRSAWIGASDEEEEGTWKWVTGPEAGTVFWRGDEDGEADGYQNWYPSRQMFLEFLRRRFPGQGQPGDGSVPPNLLRRTRGEWEPSASLGDEDYAAWNWGRDRFQRNGPPRGGWSDVHKQHTLGYILIEYSPDFPAEGAGVSGTPIEQE